jgi:arylsulfatase A
MSKRSERRRFLQLMGTGAAALTLPGMRRLSGRGQDHPNLVFLLADDLGYGDLGSYGHPTIKTPHIDGLASDGMRFTSCYAPAPNCSPSRAGYLTGRHPYRVGVYNWIPDGNPMHLRRPEITLPEWLKKRGYDTGLFGKWHLSGKFNSPAQPQPDDHGFDYWFATANRVQPSHVNPANFVRNGEPVGQIEGLSAHIVAEEALRWLNNRADPSRPFCLFAWFHEPHMPIATTERYKQMYPDATEREATYYGDVSHLDDGVGKIVKGLDEMGARENTFVFFTSDNGPEYRPDASKPGSAGPLRGKKGHTYEGGIRVPGIARWPERIPSGAVSDEPISGLDLLPTVAEIANLPIPADRHIDGQSMTPVFEERPINRQQPLYWQMNNAHHRHKIAIRDGRWKLLATRGFTDFELYDLAKDRGEQNDLAGQQPERVRELAVKMKSLHHGIHRAGYDWPGLNDLGRRIRPD